MSSDKNKLVLRTWNKNGEIPKWGSGLGENKNEIQTEIPKWYLYLPGSGVWVCLNPLTAEWPQLTYRIPSLLPKLGGGGEQLSQACCVPGNDVPDWGYRDEDMVSRRWEGNGTGSGTSCGMVITVMAVMCKCPRRWGMTALGRSLARDKCWGEGRGGSAWCRWRAWEWKRLWTQSESAFLFHFTFSSELQTILPCRFWFQRKLLDIESKSWPCCLPIGHSLNNKGPKDYSQPDVHPWWLGLALVWPADGEDSTVSWL